MTDVSNMPISRFYQAVKYFLLILRRDGNGNDVNVECNQTCS